MLIIYAIWDFIHNKILNELKYHDIVNILSDSYVWRLYERFLYEQTKLFSYQRTQQLTVFIKFTRKFIFSIYSKIAFYVCSSAKVCLM